MDFIYAGVTYTAQSHGGVWRNETCERCDRPFHYYVFLSATGSGHSPYFLDNAGARQRADRRAVERLGCELVTSPRPIPCPNCGWCNAAAARALCARRYRWVRELGLGLLAFAVFGLPLGWLPAFLMEDLDSKKPVGPTIVVVVAAAVFVLGLLVLGVGKCCEHGFDANRDIADDERLALGRSRALTQTQYEQHTAANAEPPGPDPR